MFNKLGRSGAAGRGGATSKRLAVPLPHHGARPVTPASRISSGRPDRGHGGGGPGGGGSAPEETFSMVSSGPLDFASIIRLTPDLVREIQRAEAAGGAVRIKFDSNSNDASGNVIDVDGKEFGFTWSREVGDLCDIYEEKRNGESGDGLLAERGSAWRKLNVQRILDESLKNHVKMRSKEAEHKSKSRRAIVLDIGNPSIKNQSSAAVEGSMRRMPWKQKKGPPYKKQKVETNIAPKVTPSKPVSKLSVSPNFYPKSGRSVSPLPTTPEKILPLTSPSPSVVKAPTPADIVTPVVSRREDTVNQEKITDGSAGHRMDRDIEHKDNAGCQPTSLKSMLVNLLSKNSKGLSLKAIEKAVKCTLPSSMKQIEHALKMVANFQAPGRYILKPNIGVEGSNGAPSESGSSPDGPRDGAHNRDPLDKTNTKDFETEHGMHLDIEEDADILEKIIEQSVTPDPVTSDREVNNESAEKVSSSESGSDSDSESDTSDSRSDSGSQSRSRSKSGSPKVSGSASSSESESDASSSSKETDVDVDITSSDDERGAESKLLAAELKMSSSPVTEVAYGHQVESGGYQLGDQVPLQDLNINNYEVGYDMVQHIESNHVGNAAEIPEPKSATRDNMRNSKSKGSSGSQEEMAGCLSNYEKQSKIEQVRDDRRSSIGKYEKLPVTDNTSDHRQPDIVERTHNDKTKRPSEMMNLQENVGSTKKAKGKASSISMSYQQGTNFPEQISRATPTKSEQKKHKDSMKVSDDVFEDSRVLSNSETDYGNTVLGRYLSDGNFNRKHESPDSQESGHKSNDIYKRNTFSSVEKTKKHTMNLDRVAKQAERIYSHSEESDAPSTRSMPLLDKFSVQRNKGRHSIQDEHLCSSEKNSGKSTKINVSKEGCLSISNSRSTKSSIQRRQKDARQKMNSSGAEIDSLAAFDGKESMLRRDTSELEMGELRESLTMEDIQGNRQSGERGSPRSFENETIDAENLGGSTYHERPMSKFNVEVKGPSPTNPEGRYYQKQEAIQKRVPQNFAESTKPQQWEVTQSHQLQRTEWPDSEVASQFDNRENHLSGTENNHGLNIKPINGHDGNIRLHIDSKPNGESNQQRNNESREPYNWKKDKFNSDGGSNGVKKRDIDFFSKFEKDEPELKGPIKDFSQYKEYVQEYEEKYQCYLELGDHMEKIRDDFLKIGGDLPDLAKRRDTKAFKDCSRRVMKFHHQHKMELTRLKRIFVVLHEELATLKQRMKKFVEEYTRE